MRAKKLYRVTVYYGSKREVVEMYSAQARKYINELLVNNLIFGVQPV